MKLPDLLMRRGVDPDEFLKRVVSDRYPSTYTLEPVNYIDAAMVWHTQPEGHAYWHDAHIDWKAREDKERWPELELKLGWLDPLEAELLEVNDEAT